MKTYDHVVNMALDGRRPPEIAAELAIHITTVYEKIGQARRKGVAIAKFSCKGRTQPKRRASMPPSVQDALAPYAEARGVTVIELGERLLASVARDQLADAILDDGITS